MIKKLLKLFGIHKIVEYKKNYLGNLPDYSHFIYDGKCYVMSGNIVCYEVGKHKPRNSRHFASWVNVMPVTKEYAENFEIT